MGTFPMRVGGGGNCGSEPSAAIEQMKPGDALISVQEEALSPALQAVLRARPLPRRFEFRPRPRRFDLHDLYLYPPPRQASMGFVRLTFSEAGRAYFLLVYVKGPAAPKLRRQVGAILGGLRFSRNATARPVETA